MKKKPTRTKMYEYIKNMALRSVLFLYDYIKEIVIPYISSPRFWIKADEIWKTLP